MFIKQILEEEDQLCTDCIVSDGNYDLKCSCIHNLDLEIGMEVKIIEVFARDILKIYLIEEEKEKFPQIEKLISFYGYILRGKIFDRKKALVKIGELLISLEGDFEEGFPEEYKEGDFVEFLVDEINCCLSNDKPIKFIKSWEI